MRPIDADDMLAELKPITFEMEHSAVTIADMSNIMRSWVERQPTLTPPNEWVSVGERLPEDDVPKHKAQIAVLVLTDRKVVKIKNRTYHPARFYYGKFCPERWDWGTFNDDHITHWTPLPAPPGEDNNVPIKEQNEALTIEQLQEQIGGPIIINETWCYLEKIVNGIAYCWRWYMDFADEWLLEQYGKTWFAYRRPPERQEDT